ncbi:hypothetical protein GOD90_24320 [Sinorhizobium medicae]|nr:hypothetical protein [Sinorhizobium medicae]MDX0900063.1 hypothetical protein [Sinorhizobium medicae]MDX1045407.1 hypothetical protein [Sinorhizobium medicae]MDX1119776.1 hypothetical protein [Sinorhizobium medicae]MDX1132023.1 hypothetical protein [Sinorhizobium medicae]
MKADRHSQIVPRGLNREQSAAYIGVSPSKFDQMVADRRMPRPKRIDGRTVWDRYQLDSAFDDLPSEKSGIEAQLEASGKRARLS